MDQPQIVYKVLQAISLPRAAPNYIRRTSSNMVEREWCYEYPVAVEYERPHMFVFDTEEHAYAHAVHLLHRFFKRTEVKIEVWEGYGWDVSPLHRQLPANLVLRYGEQFWKEGWDQPKEPIWKRSWDFGSGTWTPVQAPPVPPFPVMEPLPGTLICQKLHLTRRILKK